MALNVTILLFFVVISVSFLGGIAEFLLIEEKGSVERLDKGGQDSDEKQDERIGGLGEGDFPVEGLEQVFGVVVLIGSRDLGGVHDGELVAEEEKEASQKDGSRHDELQDGLLLVGSASLAPLEVEDGADKDGKEGEKEAQEGEFGIALDDHLADAPIDGLPAGIGEGVLVLGSRKGLDGEDTGEVEADQQDEHR